MDDNLYPQTLIAGMVGLHHDAFYYISELHYLFVPPGTTSLVEIKNTQKRPDDWGISERLKLARKLIRENNKINPKKNIHDMIVPLMQFSALTFKKMCEEDISLCEKFIKSILKDANVVESETFWHSILNYVSLENDENLKYKMLEILHSNSSQIQKLIKI